MTWAQCLLINYVFEWHWDLGALRVARYKEQHTTLPATPGPGPGSGPAKSGITMAAAVVDDAAAAPAVTTRA